jgi:hypothetical protein
MAKTLTQRERSFASFVSELTWLANPVELAAWT